MTTPRPISRYYCAPFGYQLSSLVLLGALGGCFDLEGVPDRVNEDPEVNEDPGAGTQDPDADRQCMVDADCATPTSICDTAEGATCVDGSCNYPELPCNTPPPGRCIDGGRTLVRSVPNGTCSEDAGGCVYDEESIAVDPVNCEAIAGGCGVVQCPDTDCALRGMVDLESPACDCVYETFLDDTQECEAVTTLCSAQATCDGAGGCENRSDLLPAGEPCLFFGEPVEALDRSGLPRALEPEEVREWVPVPFCEGPSGRCIECTADDAEAQCDDGNPCTQDLCEEGLCQNLSEPQDDAECTLPGGGLFGSTGFCARGTCLRCDSTITDVVLRDAACIRFEANGDVDACLVGATCVNNQCDYDLINDPTRGSECIRGASDSGVCSLGTCVECLSRSQCSFENLPPELSSECVDTSCENNTCGFTIRPDGGQCEGGNGICENGECR